MEMLIVSKFHNGLFTTCKKESVQEEIDRAQVFYAKSLLTVSEHKINYPDNAKYWQGRIDEFAKKIAGGFEAITWEEYEKREREKWLSKEPTEITKEEYEYALNVLPPKKWYRNERYSMFFIGECTAMSFYGQYLYNKENGKYYYATADIFDESTWLDKMLKLVA